MRAVGLPALRSGPPVGLPHSYSFLFGTMRLRQRRRETRGLQLESLQALVAAVRPRFKPPSCYRARLLMER